MQIVVVSDTHSRNEILDRLEEKYKDAYALIHCGDLEDDPRYYPRWLVVRGTGRSANQSGFSSDLCDAFSSLFVSLSREEFRASGTGVRL